MNKKLMTLIAAAISVSLLTGCQTRQQRLQSAQLNCSEFGFKYGTPEYASCVQSSYTAATERQNQAFQNLGRQMQSMSQPPALQAPTMINCTSRRIGSTVNTNCF